MKNTIRILAVLAVILFSASQANAQDQTVVAGQTTSYYVDSTDTGTNLSWDLPSGGVLTESATAGSATVVWGTTPGDYTITMTEANNASATCATDNSFVVRIVAAGALSFTSTSATLCADGSDISLSFNYTGTQYPITVEYDIDNNGSTSSASVTINNAGELNNAIVLAGASYTADEDLADVSNRTIVVDVTAAYANNDTGAALDISTNDVYTHTVVDVPETNPIQAL